MILLLAILGFALLATGTWRQSALLFGRVPPAKVRTALLAAGYAFLAASLALVLTGPDMPRRLVAWFGWLSLAAAVPLLACWAWDGRRR